jgi:hypothetical protein
MGFRWQDARLEKAIWDCLIDYGRLEWPNTQGPLISHNQSNKA